MRPGSASTKRTIKKLKDDETCNYYRQYNQESSTFGTESPFQEFFNQRKEDIR